MSGNRTKRLRALYKSLGYDLEDKRKWRSFKKYYKSGGLLNNG